MTRGSIAGRASLIHKSVTLSRRQCLFVYSCFFTAIDHDNKYRFNFAVFVYSI